MGVGATFWAVGGWKLPGVQIKAALRGQDWGPAGQGVTVLVCHLGGVATFLFPFSKSPWGAQRLFSLPGQGGPNGAHGGLLSPGSWGRFFLGLSRGRAQTPPRVSREGGLLVQPAKKRAQDSSVMAGGGGGVRRRGLSLIYLAGIFFLYSGHMVYMLRAKLRSQLRAGFSGCILSSSGASPAQYHFQGLLRDMALCWFR